MVVLLSGWWLGSERVGVLAGSIRRLAQARCALRAVLVGFVLLAAGCQDTGEVSRVAALAHAELLVTTATRDVEEVRQGLPEGVKKLESIWIKNSKRLEDDPAELRETLETTRNAVQDLRVAKSTFFALASSGGVVLRNDQEQDLMAGKLLFEPFPALARAVQGDYVETTGVLPEAFGVKGKPDGQWVAAQGVRVNGETRALYVTGWAWSSYSYRLEFALRGQVTSELKDKRSKVPLLYVFVIVDEAVYSAPMAPEVNAQAIAALGPLAKLRQQDGFSAAVEITGRRFGLAAKLAPALGSNVALAVLRSET
ncbi:MAG: hypothetical protein ABW217_06335 [Polyangiaceae bacterium]